MSEHSRPQGHGDQMQEWGPLALHAGARSEGFVKTPGDLHLIPFYTLRNFVGWKQLSVKQGDDGFRKI